MARSKLPYEANRRRFATFAEAEGYLRRGVAAGRIPLADAWLDMDGMRFAHVRTDALGRTWTDIAYDAAPLIPATGPCVWDTRGA